jgi:4-hydroxyphenylpyruvate dioxygenase
MTNIDTQNRGESMTTAKKHEEKQIRIRDMVMTNYCELDGMDFMEYGSNDPAALGKMFETLGFTKIAHHKTKNIDLYRQGDANFLINNEFHSFATQFKKAHGPSICSTGFRCKNAIKSFDTAVSRGAKPYTGEKSLLLGSYPAIYGIGDSIIYFIDKYSSSDSHFDEHFNFETKIAKGLGFSRIDHMTNNVPQGDMKLWADFYSNIFGFRERRYFDIKGLKTGLLSKAMISPCKKIMIPVNEPQDPKSQIQEYINEYKGSGIQHVALLTDDIVPAIAELIKRGIQFLDIPDSYYEMVKDRVPNVTENVKELKKNKILVDGDDEGYLLQIFTKNMIGPIFFEVIQRKNNDGFGDGNFQALFDAMERDQMARGVL